MVAADGKLEPEEIAVAEEIGKGLFQDFDPVDFRERCNILATSQMLKN